MTIVPRSQSCKRRLDNERMLLPLDEYAELAPCSFITKLISKWNFLAFYFYLIDPAQLLSLSNFLFFMIFIFCFVELSLTIFWDLALFYWCILEYNSFNSFIRPIQPQSKILYSFRLNSTTVFSSFMLFEAKRFIWNLVSDVKTSAQWIHTFINFELIVALKTNVRVSASWMIFSSTRSCKSRSAFTSAVSALLAWFSVSASSSRLLLPLITRKA